jgi:4-amino-4-deoxy-L-arabinose transferase-like glycosyltransferase
MTIMMLAYAVAVPAASGFLFVTWCTRSETGTGALERLFLGFGIGTGMITFEMFLLGLLRIPLNSAVISIAQIATTVLLGYLLYRSGTPWRRIFRLTPERPDASPATATYRERIIVLVLIAWILAKVLFVVYEGFFLPEHTSDSWEHWSSGAKFIFYEKGLALDPGNEYFFGAGYLKGQRYPLNVPLMQVWISLCIGEAHEVYMKVWNALFFLCMVGLLFFALRRKTTLMTAVLAAFFLSAVPLLTYHALTAYADLPLGFYALGAMVCFWNAIEAQKSGRGGHARGLLVLMGAFTALCVWTKMEGLFFAAAFSASLALYCYVKKISFKQVTAFLAPLVLITVPWYVFLFSIGVPVSYGKGELLGATITKGIHFQVVPVIAEQVLFSANFNLIFLFLLLLILVGYRRIMESGLGYLYTALFSVMVIFLVLYLGTETYRWVMNLTAVNRNILTFIPMMYYVAALTASTLLEGRTVANRRPDR